MLQPSHATQRDADPWIWGGIYHPGLAENIAPDGGPGCDVIWIKIIIQTNCQGANKGFSLQVIDLWKIGYGQILSFSDHGPSWDPTGAGMSANPKGNLDLAPQAVLYI